jgi:hypothetical protein
MKKKEAYHLKLIGNVWKLYKGNSEKPIRCMSRDVNDFFEVFSCCMTRADTMDCLIIHNGVGAFIVEHELIGLFDV